MIVFFQTRRDLQSYFELIAQTMSLPAKVLSAKQSVIPNFQALCSPPMRLLDNAIDYKVIEKRFSQQRELSALERAFYRFKSKWLYAADVRQLKKNKATLVIVWNGLKYRQAIMQLAAKSLGIRLAYMENGLLPDTTVFDFSGVNAGNSLSRSSDFYLQQQLPPFSFKQFDVRAAATKKLQGLQTLPEHFVFVPFQVDADSQIIKYSPWLKNMQQLFDVVVEAFADSDLHVVFKEHPSSASDYSALHTRLPNSRFHFANDINTQLLIERASYVITINSTVGIEALSLAKKIIVLGEACYDLPGLCLSAASVSDLSRCVKEVADFSINQHLRENFLAYLQHRYLIQGSWKTPSAAHCAQLVSCIEQGIAQ